MRLITASIRKNQKKIVAYTSKGEALTLEQYQSSLEEARKEYLHGKVVTQ